MGFIHFYIIFGTNLLMEAQPKLLFFCLFQCFAEKEYQTEWNLWERDFWNKRDPEDLEWTSRHNRGGHETGRHVCPPGRAPHPRGALVAPLTDFFRLYISTYPENIQEHHKTLFALPQASVPGRSHLGTFSGAPPEGESIMEGFYINTIAPPISVSSLPQTFGSIVII